jgi:hypothetical protein
MQAMTYRWQAMQPLPEKDSVHIVLRHPDGTTYAVDMPWLVEDTCAVAPSSSGAVASRGAAPIAKGTSRAEDLYQRRFHESAGLTARTADALQLQPSADPILQYGTTVQNGKTYGVIYLESFEPTLTDSFGNVNYELTLDEMTRILTGPLANTEGLIIDVRDNGGGWISFGEEMLQLFSPTHVQSEGFRLLNTALNAFVIDTIAPTDSYDGAFKPLIDAARGTTRIYTGTAPLTVDAWANGRSQAYFGPVAVLTNSACFSTCDMFTAGMQDNGLATIWGEDRHTGGGGANVVDQTWFGAVLPPDNQGPFQPLPGGQSMRVAWRDAIRVGLHDGEILEDYGVTADRNAGLTVSDVLNGGTGQIAAIARDLGRQAQREHVGRGVLHDDGDDTVINVTAGTKLAIPATVTGTSRVEMIIEGTPLGGQEIDKAGDVVLSPCEPVTATPGYHQVEIRGTWHGEPVWRVFRWLYVTAPVPAPTPAPAATASP